MDFYFRMHQLINLHHQIILTIIIIIHDITYPTVYIPNVLLPLLIPVLNLIMILITQQQVLTVDTSNCCTKQRNTVANHVDAITSLIVIVGWQLWVGVPDLLLELLVGDGE